MKVAFFAACATLFATQAMAETTLATMEYTCDRGARVWASYITTAEGAFAIVNIEGRQVPFNGVAAKGTDAEFLAVDPKEPYVWVTQGKEANMGYGAKGSIIPIYARCVAQ